MLYFDKIRAALLSEDPDEEAVRLRAASLASVKDEPGLHQLVPYFVQFISEKVTHSMRNCFVLRQMMELANALIENPTLNVAPSVNYLSAAILTCVVGRRIGSGQPEDDQSAYDLRNFSASLLGRVAKQYEKSSQQLKSRLARTCLKTFLTPTMPLAVHYGAINALINLAGAEAVRMLILPNLKDYETLLTRVGETKDVEMVVGIIMKGIELLGEDAVALTNGHMDMDRSDELVQFLGPMFGQKVAQCDNKVVKSVLELKG